VNQELIRKLSKKMTPEELIIRLNIYCDYLHSLSHYPEVNNVLKEFYQLFKEVIDWDYDLEQYRVKLTCEEAITILKALREQLKPDFEKRVPEIYFSLRNKILHAEACDSERRS